MQTAAEIQQLVQQIENRSLRQSDVTRTTDPLVREPLQVAQMIQHIEGQLERHDRNLARRSSEIETKRSVNLTRRDNGGSLTGVNPSETGSPATSTSPGSNPMGAMAGLAGPAAGVAAAAGGARGGGAGAGGSGAAPIVTPDMSNYGTASTIGDSLSGGVGGSQRQGGGSGGAGGSPIPSTRGGARDLASTDAKGTEGLASTTAASSNLGKSNLKNALRARLAAGAGRGGSGKVESTGASIAGSGTAPSAGGEQEPIASAPALSNLKLEPLASTDLGSGSIGSLGGESFGLAGSETDAYVQSVVGSLGGQEPGSSDFGALADNSHQSQAILAADSESLFERTRETHHRCLKKGLLMTATRNRLAN